MALTNFNNPKLRIVLDIPIWDTTLKQIPKIVCRFIASPGKKTFFYVNAHTLNIAGIDKDYKKILKEASLVYSGGIGPVIASRILNQPLTQRTPTPDFINQVFNHAQKKNWSVYLLGTKQKSLIKTVQKLKNDFPKLNICGYHHGFFTKREEAKIISEINLKNPTIVIVGMGTPKQEKWIRDNINKVDAKAFWAVGALLDVISNELPRAPLWIQKLNLEWLFRLFQDPIHLWKRYLIGNINFVAMVFLSLIKDKFINKLTISKLSYRHSASN